MDLENVNPVGRRTTFGPRKEGLGRALGSTDGDSTPMASKPRSGFAGGSTRRALGDITNKKPGLSHTRKIGSTASKTPFSIAQETDVYDVEYVSTAPKVDADAPRFTIDDLMDIASDTSKARKESRDSFSPLRISDMPCVDAPEHNSSFDDFEDDELLDFPFPSVQPLRIELADP